MRWGERTFGPLWQDKCSIWEDYRFTRVRVGVNSELGDKIEVEMIRKILPKNKSEWIILFGSLVYLTADLIHSTVQFDPLNATSKAAFIEWLIRLIRDLSFAVAISVMIIAGIRLIRKEGFTLKRLFLPTIGICVVIGYLGVSLFVYQNFSKLQDLGKTSDSLRSKMESSLNSDDVRPEQKATRSKLYANMRYHEDGVLIKYFTPDGKSEFFAPTEKEKKERDEFVKANKLFQSVKRSSYWAIYFWVAVIALSLALGFFPPVIRKPPNNGADSDAADFAA